MVNTETSPQPHGWTRINISIPASTQPADDVIDAANIIPDYNQGEGQAEMAYHAVAFYGPGELETYRHTQLQQAVKDAKLKVWYPGRWHRHSPRAYFRTRLDNVQELWKGGSDDHEVVLFQFRSNARLLSAEWMDQMGEELQSISQNTRLRWQTTMPIHNEDVFDHTLHISTKRSRSGNDNDPHNISGGVHELKSGSFLHMEFDTTGQYSGLEGMDSDKGESTPRSGGGGEPSDSDGDGNIKTDSDLAENPPPCIILQLPLPIFTPNQNKQHEQKYNECRNWEWKEYGSKDWIPISSCWKPPFKMDTLNTNGNVGAPCIFPHQMDLSKVSTVLPKSRVNCGNNDLGSASSLQDAFINDFGKELLGKVCISIPASLPAVSPRPPLPPIVKLRVGETLEEALNDDEDQFEQCLDLSYHLTTDDHSTEDFNAEQVWVSNHLLAFRYARVIIPIQYHYHAKVTCQAHSPLLEQCSSFSFGNGCRSKNPDDPEKYQLQNCEQDAEIWQAAADTLQLCIHHNFIVDGIKRDRLPWVGDLAVSLMANAYTFCDKECTRWSLTVLGRCGMDKLALPSHDDGEGKDSSTKKSMLGIHVNGIIDYSLWFIICHWLYQRYFGDKHFLQQEWRLIELRLTYLIGLCNDEEGWLVINKEDQVFIDWTADGEKYNAVQILWWQALDCGISLAQKMTSLGNKSQYQSMKETMSRLENSFLKMEDIQLGFSRHSHILAVLSGLYTRLEDRAREGDWSNPDSSDDRWQTLCRCRNLYQQSAEALRGDQLSPVATPNMKHLECLAISRLGERPSALKIIRSYWGGMLARNATTFFEAFNENESLADVAQFYDRPFARSLCHAWASGPCSLYPEIMLGLRPLSDGWQQWICDPLDCVLSVSAAIITQFGIIDVQLDADSLCVVVPDKSTMILMEKSYSSGKYSFPRESLISSQLVHEWSKKYRGWQHHESHVIKPNPMIPSYETIRMTDVPTVYQIPEDDKFYMSFIGYDGIGYQTFVAESSDLLEWTNMKLAMGYGEEGMFDFGGVVLGAYLYENSDIDAPRVLKRKHGKFYCLYGAYAKKGTAECPLYEPDPGYQGLACSLDGLHWQREQDESILSVYSPGIVKDWEKDSIYQPWLVEHVERYYNFYNAKQMPQWVEQLGLATSKDLRNWTRHADNPILRVDKRIGTTIHEGYDTQFTSDAKVFWDRDESHWTMFYFGVGKGGAHIMAAYSKDLIHWVRDSNPLYTAGENPSGLDKQYAHKISLVWNPFNETWYMFYCAVGDAGRGIGLLTSRPL